MTETASPFDTLPPDRKPTGMAKPPAKGRAKGKAPGRFGEINSFVDVTLRELKRAELAAWLVLWRDARSGTTTTSLTDIAERGGMTRRMAIHAVNRLREMGLVRLVRKGNQTRGPNVYAIRPTVPTVGRKADSAPDR